MREFSNCCIEIFILVFSEQAVQRKSLGCTRCTEAGFIFLSVSSSDGFSVFFPTHYCCTVRQNHTFTSLQWLLLTVLILCAQTPIFALHTGLTSLYACVPDDETPGLYGFLHVIVHSAKGFKQSASKLARNGFFFSSSPNCTCTHTPPHTSDHT